MKEPLRNWRRAQDQPRTVWVGVEEKDLLDLMFSLHTVTMWMKAQDGAVLCRIRTCLYSRPEREV